MALGKHPSNQIDSPTLGPTTSAQIPFITLFLVFSGALVIGCIASIGLSILCDYLISNPRILIGLWGITLAIALIAFIYLIMPLNNQIILVGFVAFTVGLLLPALVLLIVLTTNILPPNLAFNPDVTSTDHFLHRSSRFLVSFGRAAVGSAG